MVGRVVTICLADIVLGERRARHNGLTITVRSGGDIGLMDVLGCYQAMVRVALAPDRGPLQTNDHRKDEHDAEPCLQG